MTRWLISLAALTGYAALAPAEPIRWGYRVVDDATGAVLAEQSGLTDPWLSFTAALRPELDGQPGGAGNPNFDPNPSAENRSRVTIIDEASGGQEELFINHLVTQQWDLRSIDGQLVWDLVSEFTDATRISPAYLWRPAGGRSEYLIAGDGGSVYVEVSALQPAGVPEPGTIALAAFGLTGLGLLRRRRE